MSGAHEAMEHAEHTEHAGHENHHGKSGKYIGLTMAIMGVLIALSAAMVGTQRNELIATMMKQTQAHSDFSGASTKFRLIMLDLEKLRGIPATTVQPGEQKSILRRFLQLYEDYSNERKFTKELADSYQPLINAHFEAAEGYELAQLIAEIGIVLASLAVLLGSRTAWIISIVLGILCLGQLGKTCLQTHHEVFETTEQVTKAEEAYHELRKAHVAVNEDEATVEALDPGGEMRALLSAHKEKK